MARTAKNKALTLEEKLEQALVPVEEQPYPVPGNWVWVKLNAVTFITKLAGFEYTKNIYPNLSESGIPLFKGKNIQSGDLIYEFESYIPEWVSDELQRSQLNKRCLLTPYVGTIGNVALFDGEIKAHLGSNVGKIEILNNIGKSFEEEYLLYFLRSTWGYNELTKHKKATAQESISIAAIRDVNLPLPPYTEQIKIVWRVKELYHKLDIAIELAQSVLSSHSLRKNAILEDAFSGKLTAYWRLKHSINDSWKTEPLSLISALQTGLAKGKSPIGDTVTLPYLRVANVQDGYLDLDEIKTITILETKRSRYTLMDGDVLFTEGGDYDKLGRGTVWHDEIPNCLHQNHVFAVRPKKKVLDSQYLAYLASSQYGKRYFLSCSKQTTNLASINSTQLKAFPVKYPSFPEQQEIVRILDSFFEKERRAKELCKEVLNKIEYTKKSILARAFRGELGTNDPNEDSALELLKQVLIEQD